MKTKKFNDKDEWLEGRKGKITGSRLKDIVVKRGTEEKIGFYEIIAERLVSNIEEEENPMDRGTRLEEEALKKFEKIIGKKIDNSLVIWERDDDTSIAISPDGIISDEEAVEVKCLSSSRHIQAYLTNEIPSEYEYQVLQYFIVNENLNKLYFVMYDPRMPEKYQVHYFVVKREDKQQEVDYLLDYQRKKLLEINKIVNELTF